MLPSKSAMKNAAWFGLGVVVVMGLAPIIFAAADRLTGGTVGNIWNGIFGGIANVAGVGGPGAGTTADTDLFD